MTTEELLIKLTENIGISGMEEETFSVVDEMLKEYLPVKHDNLYNTIATSSGKGKHILLDAHIDKIGLIVRGIDEKGFILFDKCGGVDISVLVGNEVIIRGKKDLFGVVCSIPPHLAKDDKKIPKITEMSIDCGLSKEETEKYICQGDRIYFKSYPCKLLNNQFCSNGLDNRVSVAVIIKCLELLKKENVKANLTVMFSSQEEISASGAKVGAFAVSPDEAIVLDTTFAVGPNVSKYEAGEMGKGALIGFSPILDRKISLELCKVATENNIPFAKEVMSGRTGTNADVIGVSGSGVACCTLSVPIKNMHTYTEIVSIDDVDSASLLLAEYIKKQVNKDD